MTIVATTLRAVAEVSLGRQRSPQHAEGPYMMPYLRAANVKDGVLDLTDVQEMNFSPAEQEIFSLSPGDVLVTEGSGSLGTVGASAVWRGELPGMVCYQNTLLRLRPREITDGRFLGWWARSAFGTGVFASIATGANIHHLSAERVRTLPIRLPPLEEQRRIADFLDAETSRIARLIALRSHQASLISSYLSARVSETYEELLGQYGAIRLRHVLMGIEQGWSPQCEDRPAEQGEWGVVKAGCVNSGVFDPRQHKALPVDVTPRTEYRLNAGDLLMSRASGSPSLIGSVGVVGEYEGNLLLCDKLYRISLDKTRMAAGFVAHMLRSHRVREHIKNGISGADGMANNLPTGVVKDCVLPNIPLACQEQISRGLERVTKEASYARSLIERSRELLVEHRQALITAAVGGQFDVSTANGRGVEE
ncbi:restriction endonuclease subunit S [Nonomuraea sp. NPDC049419]|uniref:restriction endonuclease subunit S n=1 Tax=Nonomuraea sp. NPDC049419 TaxID=3155772 RepID=UPI00342B63E8